MPQTCIICQHLQKEGGGTTSLISLVTELECVLGSVPARPDDVHPGRGHVMADVCADHVAAIYRGRVPGVTMAWRTVTRA